jgi:hypothetical protein
VIQNCVLYTVEDLEKIKGKPIRKYWHDVGPWLGKGVREWLDENAKPICCSPLQAEYMGLDGALCIPPPVNYAPFTAAAASINGDRRGGLHRLLAQLGQGPAQGRRVGGQRGQGDRLLRWRRDGPQRVAGGALRAHPGAAGELRDVRLPAEVIEPFGRLVAEAYAAGCEIVTNNLVGAKWWIENDQLALENPAERFWKEVLR